MQLKHAVLAAALAAPLASAAAQTAAPPPPATAPWSVRMAESVMARNPVVHQRWDYVAGLMLQAIWAVGDRTGDPRYAQYVRANMDRLVKPDGTIDTYRVDEFNLDQINQGRLLFPLFERTGDERYRKAAFLLRDQLRHHPRTSEGGFWHKQIYPQQMWLDGIYMASPFYAEFGRVFGEPAAFDDVAKQIFLVTRHTRDPKTGLLYHGWDESHSQFWADTATGLSPNFWGRAVGWYMMALVDVLDELPATHPQRAEIVRLLAQTADAVTHVQDPQTGLWWQVLDEPNRRGNYLEASASTMFVYALARGANRGYLDRAYLDVARRGWDGVIRELVSVDADGHVSLNRVCQVAGLGGNPRRDGSLRDGSFAYYVSEPVVSNDYKGVGPFVLAALELGQ